MNNSNKPTAEVSFGVLAFDEVSDYVQDNFEDFDENLLEENVFAMNMEEDMMDKESLNISDDDIEEYLIDDIDNQILEEDFL